jgi:hypothetical protein
MTNIGFELVAKKTAADATPTIPEDDDEGFEEFMRSLKGKGVEDARIDAMRETRYGPKTSAYYDGKHMCDGTGQYPTKTGGWTPAGSCPGCYETNPELSDTGTIKAHTGVPAPGFTASNPNKNTSVMEMDRPAQEPMRPQRGEVRRPSTDQRKVRRQMTVKAGHDPIAYTYEADVHCPSCTFKRFPNGEGTDREGNQVGAIAPWDETDEAGEYCGDCHGEIAPPSDEYLEDKRQDEEVYNHQRPHSGQGRMFGSAGSTLEERLAYRTAVVAEHDASLLFEAEGPLTFDGEPSYTYPNQDFRDDDDSYMDCPGCGKSMYMGDSSCPHCGWNGGRTAERAISPEHKEMYRAYSGEYWPGKTAEMDLRTKLVMAVTEYDRKEEAKGGYYNRYALPQYLGAVGDAVEEINSGTPVREALNSHFNGRLLTVVLKAAGEKRQTNQEADTQNRRSVEQFNSIHGAKRPEEGNTRCACGSKYWDKAPESSKYSGRYVCASCGDPWDGKDYTDHLGSKNASNQSGGTWKTAIAAGYYLVGPNGAPAAGPFDTMSQAEAQVGTTRAAAIEYKSGVEDPEWNALRPKPFPYGMNTVNGSKTAEYHYIRENGGKYEIWQKGTGKTLSTHDSRGEAESAFRAMESHMHGGSKTSGVMPDEFTSTCGQCHRPIRGNNQNGWKHDDPGPNAQAIRGHQPLPASKTSSRIDTINQVLEGGIYGDDGKTVKLDGAILDHTSAQLLKQIYDALSTDEARAKFERLPLNTLMDFAWKQTRK